MNTASRVKLTIPNGTKVSATLSAVLGAGPAQVAISAASAITIQSPAALTGTIIVEASIDGVAWATVQDNLADVVPAAGKINRLPLGLTAQDLRITSASNEGAARDFWLSIQEC